jgi:ribulose 1,5-bisphosphate synthetase/thiazole synthase
MGCGSSVPATEAMKGKHVVIVGYGPAGSAVAKALAGKVRLTIVHKLDAYHHNMCVSWGVRWWGWGGGMCVVPRRVEALPFPSALRPSPS